MTASNDSLNSAFTDSSAADGDETPQKDMDPEDEDLPPAQDTEEQSSKNSSNSTNVDDDRDQTLTKDNSRTLTQTSADTEENDGVVEEERENPSRSTGSAASDEEDLESSNTDPRSSMLNTVDRDDVTEPAANDDNERYRTTWISALLYLVSVLLLT